MKKKPQQCKRQGKSNTNIKSFLNNLKENDLHFEDSQITQCVFLGVLRLKPVPSVFSSNIVPSVVVENKSKRFKNNNSAKEINKNVSRKKDINKVISGRIGKKNTEKIKASIKKFPIKKPVIKLKFNMNNGKKDTSSVNLTETVRILPESLTKITPESVYSNQTITLNPITTVTTFNPVQNLFDKLKLQLDDKYIRPGSTEVSKESLFFNELLDVDNVKSSRKQKKSNKRNKSDKSITHLLPSSSSFSDNGYYSSNSSLHTKSSEDVVISNHNDIDCGFLLNTGPANNDVILIPDDTSNRSSPNQDVIVIDDLRNVRVSPRLNKNEQNSSITQQKDSDTNNIINLGETEPNIKPPKTSTDKPIKRRRTLMPSAIPSIFFNTPRLLRSELGQKKGNPPETKNSKSVKPQKPENKQLLKQKREKVETKTKGASENLIYEVVKSTETTKHSTETDTKCQDHVLVVENSPLKVEPLIIKLKKSTEKVSNITDQNGNGDIKNKEKSHKADAGRVTKNLFFPRLLRSDIKDTKIKKSPKVLEKSEVDTSNRTNEPASPGKISVKSTKDLFENTSNLIPKNQKPNSPIAENKTVVQKSSSNSKKTEKSPVGVRRALRSDFCQEETNSKIIDIEDTSETNAVIEIVDNSKHKSDENENLDTVDQKQLRSAESQKESEIIDVDKNDTNEGTKKNINTDISKDKQLETEPGETQSVGVEIIDVDLYEEKSKNVDNLRSESHKKNPDGINIDKADLPNEDALKNLNNSDIIDVDNLENTEDASVTSPCKSKSIAVVQPMSRLPRTPQKKVNDIESTEIVSSTEVTPEKTRKNVPKNKNTDQSVQQKSPQKKGNEIDSTDIVNSTEITPEKMKKNVPKNKNIEQSVLQKSPQKKVNDVESTEIINLTEETSEKMRKNVLKNKNIEQSVQQKSPQKKVNEAEPTEIINLTEVTSEKMKKNVMKNKNNAQLVQQKLPQKKVNDNESTEIVTEVITEKMSKNVLKKKNIELSVQQKSPQKQVNEIESTEIVNLTEVTSEKMRKNLIKNKNIQQSVQQKLPQKKVNVIESTEIVNSTEVIPEKMRKNVPKNKNIEQSVQQKLPQKKANNIESTDIVNSAEVTPEKMRKNIPKNKNIVQSVQQKSPQKQVNEIESTEIVNLTEVTPEKMRTNLLKNKNIEQLIQQKSPQKEVNESESTEIVNLTEVTPEKMKKNVLKNKNVDQSVQQKTSQKQVNDIESTEIISSTEVTPEKRRKNLPKNKNIEQSVQQKSLQKKSGDLDIVTNATPTTERRQLRSNDTQKPPNEDQNNFPKKEITLLDTDIDKITTESTKPRTLRSNIIQKETDYIEHVQTPKSVSLRSGELEVVALNVSKSISKIEKSKNHAVEARLLRDNPAETVKPNQEKAKQSVSDKEIIDVKEVNGLDNDVKKVIGSDNDVIEVIGSKNDVKEVMVSEKVESGKIKKTLYRKNKKVVIKKSVKKPLAIRKIAISQTENKQTNSMNEVHVKKPKKILLKSNMLKKTSLNVHKKKLQKKEKKSTSKDSKINNDELKVKKTAKSDQSHKRTADFQIMNQADLIVNTTRSHSKINTPEPVKIKAEQSSDISTEKPPDEEELSQKPCDSVTIKSVSSNDSKMKNKTQKKLLTKNVIKDIKKSTTVKARKVGRPKKNSFVEQSSRIEDSKSTEVPKKPTDVTNMKQAETFIVHKKKSISKTNESSEIVKVNAEDSTGQTIKVEKNSLESSELKNGKQKKVNTKAKCVIKASNNIIKKEKKLLKQKIKVPVKVIKPGVKKAKNLQNIDKLPKKKSTQNKQKDFDVITVDSEKKSTKQSKVPPKNLKSSINPVEIKKEIVSPVVENVVALIHSEPKPKDSNKIVDENKSQKNPNKNKSKSLQSQNFDDIAVVKEIATAKRGRPKKNKENKGILDKSKVISKKKTILVAKKVRGNTKNKEDKNKQKAKAVLTKSKLSKIPKESKHKVIKQVKNKLKNAKHGNPLKKPKKKPSRKSNINWQNNDIIERIIQEIKNTLFKRDPSEITNDTAVASNKIKQKKIAKPTKKPVDKKIKVIRAAKKKMLRTKEALKKKLRSAISTETTDSTENNPPTKEEPQKTPETEENVNSDKKENATIKNDSVVIINEVTVPKYTNISDKIIKPTNKDTVEVCVDLTDKTSTTIEIIDSKKNDITVFDFDESEPELFPLRPSKSNDNPIIIPDETVNTETSPKPPPKQIEPQKKLPYSRIIIPDETVNIEKSPNPPPEQTEPQKKLYSRILQKNNLDVTTGTSAPPKTYSRITDTAEYDKRIFFETPSSTTVQQKRLYSEILVYSEDEEGEAVPTKRLPETLKRTENPKQKESTTEYGVPSRKPKLLIPYLDEDGKPRKLWSIIDTSVPPLSPPRPPLLAIPRRNLTPPRTIEQTAPSTSRQKSPEPSTSSEKKSPMKQPTIIEMFSRVWMKKENAVKPFSEAPAVSNEVFSKPLPRVTNLPVAPSPARERLEDDDSDTESRVEWVPEEYAEYKFKYSSKKMMQYKPIFRCKICMLMLPSYYKLLQHRKEHEKKEKPYKCSQCGTDFANVEDFSAHLRLHKGKHPYMCSKCDAGFWTKGAYEAHIPVHILRKAKPPVKKFRCDICAKEFSKLCDVERHTRVHTGEKPCICNICNKRFQQAHNLSKHLLTHLHIKPFHCEICNKQFGRNDVLRRHLLTHSVDKPVKCSVCLRGFIRHSQLLQHMRRKHPETPIDDDLREQYGDDLREQYGDEEDLSLSDNREEPDDDEPSSSSVVAKRGTIKTEAQGSEQISF